MPSAFAIIQLLVEFLVINSLMSVRISSDGNMHSEITPIDLLHDCHTY